MSIHINKTERQDKTNTPPSGNTAYSQQKDLLFDAIFCLLCVGMVYFVFYAFTGSWPWKDKPYNSYALQADSWLHGRLDLGQDYPYLELAIFEGKYFVSFPPFPSYVLLFFIPFFGTNTPDHLITLVFSGIAVVYTLKLFTTWRSTRKHAIFWTLFTNIGTNVLFVSCLGGQVWFIAQTMAFALSMMALYYAVIGKGGLSLALWACSVGCRPMLALFFPLLAWLLLDHYRTNVKKDTSILDLVKIKWHWAIPTLVIAFSYMLLNYLRFGNIMEFGHNYLPEFMREEMGQFNTGYMAENFKHLWRLPEVTEEGTLSFYNYDGVAFWLVSPLFLSYLYYVIRHIVIYVQNRDNTGEKQRSFLFPALYIPLACIVYVMILIAHKTMGGWHFGNRYLNDILPFIFFGALLYMPEKDRHWRIHTPLFALGLSLNLIGTIALVKGWI